MHEVGSFKLYYESQLFEHHYDYEQATWRFFHFNGLSVDYTNSDCKSKRHSVDYYSKCFPIDSQFHQRKNKSAKSYYKFSGDVKCLLSRFMNVD